jgi:hypothetical protein
MGNYLSSWTQGAAQSDTQRKYHYKSLENLNLYPKDPDEEMYEDDSLPDLPIEVWSGIIVRLSFSDNVGVRGHQFYRATAICRYISALSIRCSGNWLL